MWNVPVLNTHAGGDEIHSQLQNDRYILFWLNSSYEEGVLEGFM